MTPNVTTDVATLVKYANLSSSIMQLQRDVQGKQVLNAGDLIITHCNNCTRKMIEN